MLHRGIFYGLTFELMTTLPVVILITLMYR